MRRKTAVPCVLGEPAGKVSLQRYSWPPMSAVRSAITDFLWAMGEPIWRLQGGAHH
ncbi:MAG: hypothetical protein ACUVTG_03250 [Candidatus Oleimicrobiaceae bacterium]